MLVPEPASGRRVQDADAAPHGPRQEATTLPSENRTHPSGTPAWSVVETGEPPGRSRLRIAAHNGARVFGGGEKWTVLLLAGLEARGHEVHLFCGHREIVDRARAHGVDASLGRLGGHLMLSDSVRLAGRLRRFRPDAFLVTTFKKVWLAGLAARMAGVPRTVVRIGLDSDLPRRHWTYRLAIRRWADAVLCNAEGIRRDFLADLPDVDPARVRTLYDGVALERPALSASEARRALGLPPGVPLVGTVSRLSGQKRLDRLIRAVALLPDLHCAIAGSGELEAELKVLAERLRIHERVHFLGYREDVAAVLGALDVFALTSDKEGMANAMLEAMACGVPVVSTPVSGATEALGASPDGRRPGLVVDPDPAAVADGISRILTVPATRTAMAEEAARRARERFGFSRMVDEWEAVLRGG